MNAATRQNLILLQSFTRREFHFKFAGSTLGIGWAFVSPILLLAIYSLVFGRLFSDQAVVGLTGKNSYAAYVAVALWPWMMFADGLTRGLISIQSNASLVKKIAFPHALLVVSAVNAIFIQHAIGYVIILTLLTLAGQMEPNVLGLLKAFPLIAILYFITIGLALLLAALQTMLRDVEQATAPCLMMLLFLTPVMYPISMIPESFRSLFTLNPIAEVVMRLRSFIFAGEQPTLADLGLAMVAALILLAGYSIFSRLSPYFEDFL